MPDFPPFVIVFEPLPCDIPAAVRVRALLKRALRDWKLRCRVIRPATADELTAGASHDEPKPAAPAESSPVCEVRPTG